MPPEPTPNPGLAVGFGTPWEPQIAYLRDKLRLPTQRWDDIQRSAHDRAFIIAGAAKADLLADLHSAVVRAAQDGGGLAQFRRDFLDIVRRHGWTGWTGDDRASPTDPGGAGVAWRTSIIYRTNMDTSYAAGRWRQMTDPETLRALPYWRYIHSDSVLHPRPMHLAWHGLTLPATHAFWRTHFAPNGWGCQCRITAVNRREGEASARAGLGEPPAGWDTIDPETGAPVGIDKGFDYAPGAAINTPLRQFVQDKLITYPPAITRALTADVNRYINAAQPPSAFVREVLADRSRRDPLWLGFVENFEQIGAATQTDVKGFMVLLPADAPRHIQDTHGFDGATQRPASPQDYEKLMDVVNKPDRVASGRPEHGRQRVVLEREIDGELFHAVFEVRHGKKNRALALVTLVIKTSR
ncbi:MAG: hypothetical protein Fur0019_16060 [Tibeticola sp.]